MKIDNSFETQGGRHVIKPGTEVLGGVFMGKGAIIVDYEENPAPYEAIYSEVDDFLPQDGQPLPLLTVGRVVNWSVVKAVTFSRNVTREVLKKQAEERGKDRIDRFDEVPLSDYLKKGGGICHHQTLTVGAMLQLLQNRRNYRGDISIRRYLDTPESHAWVTSTWEDDGISIDPAHDKVEQLVPGRTLISKVLRNESLAINKSLLRAGA